jgi:hypothetical protein
MRFLHLAVIALLSLVLACGEKETTEFDPTGQEWEFSLSNPLPVVPNLKVPKDLPFSARLRREVFSPGDVLRVVKDSIVVESELRVSYTGKPRVYRLFTDDYQPDSLAGFRLNQGVGTTLNVAFYKGDTLQGEWLFEAKKERLQEIAYGELTGQTYRCAFPGGDTMQVHFGVNTSTYGLQKGKELEYYVEEIPGFQQKESYIKPGRFSSRGDRTAGMRNTSFYFSSDRRAYGSKRYTYSRGEDSTVFASYIEVENGRYEKVDMPLVLLPSLIPRATAEADFADRLNSGTVIAEDTYPRIDSANVSYSYQKDFQGLEFDELSELEFSAEPGGEFLIVARDRLIMNHNWKLSSDGRYLITTDKVTGYEYSHYPILGYTDEHIDLRIPFSVKTREPRGVKLESYAMIDVFIRVVRRADATSR